MAPALSRGTLGDKASPDLSEISGATAEALGDPRGLLATVGPWRPRAESADGSSAGILQALGARYALGTQRQPRLPAPVRPSLPHHPPGDCHSTTTLLRGGGWRPSAPTHSPIPPGRGYRRSPISESPVE